MRPRNILLGPVLAALLLTDVITASYPPRNVTCDGGNRTISVTSLCDDVADCADGSDENYLGKGFKCNVNGNQRRCVLPQELLYDRNVSYCDHMLDRCFDQEGQLTGSNCFRCFNGELVIGVTQVCDGIVDCTDLSDECACQNNLTKGRAKNKANSIHPICSQLCTAHEANYNFASARCLNCSIGEVVCSEGSGSNPCVAQSQICDGVRDCPNGDDELYCTKDFVCDGNTTLATSCDDVITCEDFSDECSANCWHNRSALCKHVVGDRFYCDLTSSNTSSVGDEVFAMGVTSSKVCDGVIDCHGEGNDEAHCSTADHYYCWGGDVLFANWLDRYDGERTCESGDDECPSLFHHTLTTSYANSDELLRNPFLRAIVWFLLFPSLLGNLAVIYVTSQELWKDRKADKLGRLAKCNRTFVLNLAFADLIMGIYLLTLAIETVIKSNRYCASDRSFRSSRTCIVMGIFTQVSAQTSVFLLLLMTSYRLYGTLHPFRVEESRLIGGAASLAFLSWSCSIVIALLPQVRSLYDYFVVSYWIPLPFLSVDVLEKPEMKRLVLSIFTITKNNSDALPLPDLHWWTMIGYMRRQKMATINPDWGRQYVVPIGYYNQIAMCQPFFYPQVGDPAWLCMTTVIVFNFLAFIYIALAYVIIYRASSKPSVRKSVRRRSRQWRRDNRTMQKKIMCLVLTDMACWLPICLIFVIHMSGYPVHPIVHGITGTLILPINSAVNPIIYSNAVTNLHTVCKQKLGYINSSDTWDGARLVGASRASLTDTNGSIRSASLVNVAAGSVGNSTHTDSPNNNNDRCRSAAMRKKRANGFVRPQVSFFDSLKSPPTALQRSPSRENEKDEAKQDSDDMERLTNGSGDLGKVVEIIEEEKIETTTEERTEEVDLSISLSELGEMKETVL